MLGMQQCAVWLPAFRVDNMNFQPSLCLITCKCVQIAPPICVLIDLKPKPDSKSADDAHGNTFCSLPSSLVFQKQNLKENRLPFKIKTKGEVSTVKNMFVSDTKILMICLNFHKCKYHWTFTSNVGLKVPFNHFLVNFYVSRKSSLILSLD